MSDHSFQICGPAPPPMLGRAALMSSLRRKLTKETPDHVQVIGPRFAGKSVLLQALVREFRAPESCYFAAHLWDLAHRSPQDDDEFMRGLREQLSMALRPADPELADYLKSPSEHPCMQTMEVLDELANGNRRVLLILDGFDKPLSNRELTRNLWDQLREMASRPSLCLVTATRKGMQDLLQNADAKTSDFWSVFNPSPVYVHCFDAKDMEAVLAPLATVSLSQGARAKLMRWTGGFPPLLLMFLNEMINIGFRKTFEASTIDQLARSKLPPITDILNAVWNDCSEQSKSLYRRIRQRGEVSLMDVRPCDVDPLVHRGFCVQDDKRVTANCHWVDRMLDHTDGQAHSPRWWKSAFGFRS